MKTVGYQVCQEFFDWELKIQGGLGDRGTPPPCPDKSHWICTITTSATGVGS